jgi:hypothetical protein
MNARQFWILILGSLLLCALIIKEIFLSRALAQEQMGLIGIQDVVSTGPTYENDWKQLALSIYQASRHDPDLAALLKKDQIEIEMKPVADAASPPATTPPPPPPLPSKGPVPALPPAAP